MKIFINTLLVLISITNSFGQVIAKTKANADTRNFRYEIEAHGEGVEGTYLVKVWTYSRSPKVSITQAKKNAVHGIIFQGFAGSGKVSGQPPLCSSPSAEIQFADFFNSFFANNGPYLKYVSISGDGSVAAGDRLLVGGEYKIGVIVSVRKDLLKADLVEAGIVRTINSGF
jgi:hypothetical protein